MEATPCATFVGRLLPHGVVATSHGVVTKRRCVSCNTSACMVCGGKCDRYGPPTYEIMHECAGSKIKAEEDEAEAFEGLVRGKQYQICPAEHCKRKLELQDGKCHLIVPFVQSTNVISRL